MRRIQATVLLLALSTPAVLAQPLETRGACFKEQLLTGHLNVYGELRNPFDHPVEARGQLVVYDAAGRVLRQTIGLPQATLNPGERLPVFANGPVEGTMARCVLNYAWRPAEPGLRGEASALRVTHRESLGIHSADVAVTVRNPHDVPATWRVLVTGYDASGRVVMVGRYGVLRRLAGGASEPVRFTATHLIARPVRFGVVVELTRAR